MPAFMYSFVSGHISVCAMCLCVHSFLYRCIDMYIYVFMCVLVYRHVCACRYVCIDKVCLYKPEITCLSSGTTYLSKTGSLSLEPAD